MLDGTAVSGSGAGKRCLREGAALDGGGEGGRAAPQLEALKDAAAQLSGVARNINQIARVANRTGDPHLAAFLEERRDLGKELSRLTAQLRRMMDLAQRREDGLRRLEEARR